MISLHTELPGQILNKPPLFATPSTIAQFRAFSYGCFTRVERKDSREFYCWNNLLYPYDHRPGPWKWVYDQNNTVRRSSRADTRTRDSHQPCRDSLLHHNYERLLPKATKTAIARARSHKTSSAAGDNISCSPSRQVKTLDFNLKKLTMQMHYTVCSDIHATHNLSSTRPTDILSAGFSLYFLLYGYSRNQFVASYCRILCAYVCRHIRGSLWCSRYQ